MHATYIVVLVVGATLFEKAQGSVVSNRIGMKLGRIVLHVNAHQLMDSDFRFTVTISKWRP